MKRKAFIVLFGAVLLLMATALTEYLFYRQDENTWVERFESRLHEQERKADHLLATFRDSVDIDSEEWEEDLIFVGIREGRVFFWTNEIIGDRHLSELLTKGQKKLNRKITAEQIGEAVAQSVSHLPGIDTVAVKQMFLAMTGTVQNHEKRPDNQ